jgi:hypothetical protein
MQLWMLDLNEIPLDRRYRKVLFKSDCFISYITAVFELRISGPTYSQMSWEYVDKQNDTDKGLKGSSWYLF